MSFKLTEAFIEFKAIGVSSVASMMSALTSSSKTATGSLTAVEATLQGTGSKAALVEARLRGAVAEMNRLSAIKASGGNVDTELAKARGAVGGLSASLFKLTGKPVAEINSAFGIASTKAADAKTSVDRLKSSIASIKAPPAITGGLFSSIGGAASSAIGTLTSFKGALLGAGVAAGAFSAVNMVGQAEQTSVAFEVMLGDAQRAKSMLGEMRAFADASPFTFPGVADSSRTLLQFGVDSNSILPTIKRIGDVASGDEQKLQSLSRTFGQMTAAGRLMGQDLLEMINAGFNPLQEISRTTGESMAALKARMEAGGISAAEVAKAFETATSQGGKFFGMTERMSRTTLGRLSTLKDTALSSVRAMTEPFMGGVNSLISGAGTLLGEVQAMLTPSFAIIGKTFGDMMGGMNFKFDGASIGASLAGVTERVVGVFKGIYNAVSPIVLNTVTFITNAWQQIGPSVFSIADSITSSIVPAINFLAPMVPTVLKFVGAFLTASAVPTIFATVGGAIAAIASPIGIAVASIGGLVLWLNSGSERANYFKGIIDDVFASVGKYVVDAIDTAAFAFRNWDTLLDLAIAHAGLFVDNTAERFRAFGQNVANVATWVGDNWLNIFRDMASGTATILANIGKNLGSFLAEVKSWLSGDGFNFEIVPLTKGFKATTQALPDMVRPAIRSTTAEIDRLYKKLGESEAEFAKRQAAAVTTKAASGATPPGATPPGETPPPVDNSKKSSFLGFDALAKRMGDDSPMVKQQKRTNQLLESQGTAAYKAHSGNETMQTIPANWAELAKPVAVEASVLGANSVSESMPNDEANFGFSNGYSDFLRQQREEAAAETAGAMTTQTQPQEQVKGTLERQIAVLAQAVTALQSLVDMAANKGIKTTGSEAVYA